MLRVTGHHRKRRYNDPLITPIFRERTGRPLGIYNIQALGSFAFRGLKQSRNPAKTKPGPRKGRETPSNRRWGGIGTRGGFPLYDGKKASGVWAKQRGNTWLKEEGRERK